MARKESKPNPGNGSTPPAATGVPWKVANRDTLIPHSRCMGVLTSVTLGADVPDVKLPAVSRPRSLLSPSYPSNENVPGAMGISSTRGLGDLGLVPACSGDKDLSHGRAEERNRELRVD